MPTKTRKRLPRAEREARMLDAADLVFGRRGFQGASMDEIARRSGITKALLYQYFGSKEGLFEAAVERGVARLFEALGAAVADVPAGPAKVAAFIDGFFSHVDANRDSLWLLYAEASSRSVNAMRQRNADLIAGLVSAGFEELGRRPDPKELSVLSHYLVGAGEQVARWWVEHPEVPKEVVIDRFTESAVGAIASLFQAASAHT
jgi:AcrR family transcriptional regulator